MPRSLTSIALGIPSGSRDGRPVEGFDEDALTLAVDVLEALSRSTPGLPLARIHLVGDGLELLAEALPEALGNLRLRTVRHPTGSGPFWAAVGAAAADPEPDGSVAVFAFEGAGPSGAGRALRWGTCALALGLAERPGWRVVGPGPGADPTGSIGSRQTPDAPRGETGDSAADERPWLEPLVRRFRELASPPGGPGERQDPVPGAPDSGGATFEIEAPVAWWDVRDLPTGRDGAPTGSTPPSDDPLRHRVSEGAYLPRPTYLEHRPSRWRLAAEACPRCGTITFPSRGVCRGCGNSGSLEAIELGRTGLVVEAVTTIRPGAQPTEFDPQVEAMGDYAVVIARTPRGPKVTLQMASGRTPALGDRVSARLRRLYSTEGEWRYGLKGFLERPDPGS
ncbi:MAG TPA: hypothetical protein VLY85_01525 [Thermoplasmata archaeon]|nr:hypothetical protein [Thermoplasmata archaeon]